MPKLRPLKRNDFACKCGCGFDAVDIELYQVLRGVKRRFRANLTINSACRCESHNKAVGGASSSQHIKGKAADFVIDGAPPSQVASYLEMRYPNKYGIGRYNSFTHIDVRAKMARWDNSDG